MRRDIELRNSRILKLYQQGIARKQIAYRLKIAYETIRKTIWVLQSLKREMNEDRNKNNG